MVETISNTRENLTTHVARFRESGADSEPVVFGDHRRPEAVLLSYQAFQILLDVAEDAVLAQRIRERDANDSGERLSLVQVANELGIDLDTL